MNDNQLIEKLSKAGLSSTFGKKPGDPKWVYIWIRDNFHCGYCDAFLLENVITLYSAQIDHLLPRSKYKHLSWIDKNVNYVLACFCCNQIKRNFDPLSRIENRISKDISLDEFVKLRSNLIEEARKFINIQLNGKKMVYELTSGIYESEIAK